MVKLSVGPNITHDGACVPCIKGQFCPANTTNIDQPLVVVNICKPGETCESPERAEKCEAGRYCNIASYDGGVPCTPEAVKEQLGIPHLSWVQGIYCGAGTYLGPDGLYGKLCHAGGYCPDAAERIECPAGGFCEQGVKNWTACRVGAHCGAPPRLSRPAGQR